MDILNVNYEKYSLSNGMEVTLYRDSNLPIVSANIWYKVGSANEKLGKTGIAHLFEHMMFQGSVNVPKEKHFKFIQEAGGNLNGSTSLDRTNYYEKVPSNFLELILWLESDRMGFFLPALTQEKLANQIDVVRNERLERYDNQPYGLAWEILMSNLFPKDHPYSWSTIGSLEDISSFTLEDVSSFFEKYYSPANASLVIAGDFDSVQAKELVGKYFGGIPGKNHIEGKKIEQNKLAENKFIVHKDNVQLERLYLAFHSDKAYSGDDAALDILTDLLSGSKNSRLYKKLVFEKEVAQDVTAYQFSGKLAGYFIIIATAKPGIKLADLKENIFGELENIKRNGISEKELLRSKNGIKSSFIYSMQNIDSMADQLNSYNYFLNEPNSFNFDLGRYEKVKIENLQSVIEKYLSKSFVELHVIPQTEG
ncbi:MAG: M16 family metallopeptidase [Ignavibacteriaceae bacterium]